MLMEVLVWAELFLQMRPWFSTSSSSLSNKKQTIQEKKMKFSTVLVICLTTLIPSLLALPVEQEKKASCPVTSAPAYGPTKDALTALVSVHKFSMFAVMNEKETHDELIQAAKWQVGLVKRLISEAEAANEKDESKVRSAFFKGELAFLKLEAAASEKVLNIGLPSFPWLGQAANWVQNQWHKAKDAWNNFWHSNKDNTPAPVDPKEAAKGNQAISDFEAKIKEVMDRMSKIESNLDECEL